jgi:hypothetical protein
MPNPLHWLSCNRTAIALLPQSYSSTYSSTPNTERKRCRGGLEECRRHSSSSASAFFLFVTSCEFFSHEGTKDERRWKSRLLAAEPERNRLRGASGRRVHPLGECHPPRFILSVSIRTAHYAIRTISGVGGAIRKGRPYPDGGSYSGCTPECSEQTEELAYAFPEIERPHRKRGLLHGIKSII